MKIRVPLIRRVVAGIDCPFPQLTLRVHSRFGDFVEVPFRVDPGADLSAMPIAMARRDGIPFREDRPGLASGLVGQVEKYRDNIRVLVAGREHVWPCDFTQSPLMREGSPPSADLVPVLGRAGFLDHYACCIDNRFLVLTRISALRRWWRGLVYRVWERIGLVNAPDEPL